jgi:hypothetical protein
MKLFLIAAAAAIIAWVSTSAAEASNVHIDGVLKERGTRRPLPDVNVYCFPEESPLAAPGTLAPKPLKATTDAKGRFSVDGVPEGRFKWIVNLSGYERLELNDEQPEGAPLPVPPRELYLERSSYLGAYETTIYDKLQKRDDKTKSITGDQISKLAGASNDPIKAVQNLPGVNRVSGFSSAVIIEGSSPNDTEYQIEGQEVPIIFHFGAFTTVVPPEAVDHVDLLTSGFGVEYGRTTAGLVSVWLRNPRTDRLHGLAFFDLFNVGAMLEGPAGEHSSFFIGARQSYIGYVLKTALSGNKDFDLTVAPDFSDLTGIYQSELTPVDNFRIVTVGSIDTLNFIFNQPLQANPAIRGNFSSLTSFARVIPELTHRHSAQTVSRLSLGFGKDWVRLDTSDNYFHLQAWELTARGEVEHQFSPYWKSIWGFDNSHTWATVDFALPKLYSAGGIATPFSVAQTVNANINQSYDQIGAYWRNEVRLGDSPWTLVPALRTDYYNETRQLIPEPRLQIRYKASDTLTLRSASGFYSMAPQPQEVASGYGNPSIQAPTAVHFTAGAEKDLRGNSANGWTLTGDFFYKHFFSLVIPSSQLITQPDGTLAPENYSNNGHGRAFGLETQARYNYGPLSGWITYTLSRSTRWNPSTPEAVAGFDQTHNLAAVGSIELGRNWQLSGRFRYVTGDPYTPIVGGILDADNDIYVPSRGEFYSQRLEPFWQLDFRLDKKWIYEKWILSLYLDIQNVTNHSNTEAIRYSYNYQQTTTVQDLPFLPIFGIKGEF